MDIFDNIDSKPIEEQIRLVMLWGDSKTVPFSKEYNDNKDNLHGPYIGGRQW